ncbi:hypothetical protein PUV54_11205 [Hyphococcus flavus]|uniref:Uncharacterized protein n=1 Tax=Hyphococcus flavus TaxID=1866326 RepID=A0AAF0CF63_9PROT|nr:hypothetical protein [Hyphococcus flavus]WDI30523.1 hypothetical protein PUV54_11205 [Hyphococcus flavus]
MSNRNWGLPSKDEQLAIRDAKHNKPMLTLFVTAVFGVIGAAVAAVSFAEARSGLTGLFHGGSLIGAVIAAGFGCWMYVWLARPRFAAQLSGKGDAFSKLVRFYAKAALALGAVLLLASVSGIMAPNIFSVLFLCFAGGAGAAAAFQTVLAFVPYYEDDSADAGER